MMLARRALLAAPLLLAAEPPTVTPVAVPGPGGGMALTWVGRGAVLLPGPLQPVAMLTLAGLSLAAVSFPAAPGLELLALCGDDRPRLLGLEIWRVRRADGAHLQTRLAATSDLRRIRLGREAARPRDRLRWQRAAWTDYLAWQPPALVDAPVRPPPDGTWQAGLARLRAASLAWLATPRRAVAAADLAALGLGDAGGLLG